MNESTALLLLRSFERCINYSVVRQSFCSRAQSRVVDRCPFGHAAMSTVGTEAAHRSSPVVLPTSASSEQPTSRVAPGVEDAEDQYENTPPAVGYRLYAAYYRENERLSTAACIHTDLSKTTLENAVLNWIECCDLKKQTLEHSDVLTLDSIDNYLRGLLLVLEPPWQ